LDPAQKMVEGIELEATWRGKRHFGKVEKQIASSAEKVRHRIEEGAARCEVIDRNGSLCSKVQGHIAGRLCLPPPPNLLKKKKKGKEAMSTKLQRGMPKAKRGNEELKPKN